MKKATILKMMAVLTAGTMVMGSASLANAAEKEAGDIYSMKKEDLLVASTLSDFS